MLRNIKMHYYNLIGNHHHAIKTRIDFDILLFIMFYSKINIKIAETISKFILINLLILKPSFN